MDSGTANGYSPETPSGAQKGKQGPRKTLRDSDKLKNRIDFDNVKRRGKRESGRYLILLKETGNPENDVRCGVICSRRFHKRAVVRNRARRLIWESFRLLKSEIQPCRFVVIPKRSICTTDMNGVKADLEKLLNRT